jgi:hypothetical protein
MGSSECGGRNSEFGGRNGEVGIRSSEWGMGKIRRDSYLPSRVEDSLFNPPQAKPLKGSTLYPVFPLE